MKHGECVYNKNLVCYQYPDGSTACNTMSCGWNPPVAKARRDAIKSGGLQKDPDGKSCLHIESEKENAE